MIAANLLISLQRLGSRAGTLFAWRGFTGLWGVHPITTHDDGAFQIAEAGADALIFPTEAGDVFDLVAWYPAEPARWWVRHGLAAVMGVEAIQRACHFDEPLVLHQTPLDFLRANGVGSVVLDWRSADFWLTGVHRIVTADEKLAARVRAAFTTQVPRVRVLRQEVRDAA